MPKDLIRRLVLLDLLMLFGGGVFLMAIYWNTPDLDEAFSSFAAAQGEVFVATGSTNAWVGLLACFIAVVIGWVGLWRHKRWGVLWYGGGLILGTLSVVFEPSTVTYTRTLQMAWEDASLLVSGALLALAAYRLRPRANAEHTAAFPDRVGSLSEPSREPHSTVAPIPSGPTSAPPSPEPREALENTPGVIFWGSVIVGFIVGAGLMVIRGQLVPVSGAESLIHNVGVLVGGALAGGVAGALVGAIRLAMRRR